MSHQYTKSTPRINEPLEPSLHEGEYIPESTLIPESVAQPLPSAYSRGSDEVSEIPESTSDTAELPNSGRVPEFGAAKGGGLKDKLPQIVIGIAALAVGGLFVKKAMHTDPQPTTVAAVRVPAAPVRVVPRVEAPPPVSQPVTVDVPPVVAAPVIAVAPVASQPQASTYSPTSGTASNTQSALPTSPVTPPPVTPISAQPATPARIDYLPDVVGSKRTLPAGSRLKSVPTQPGFDVRMTANGLAWIAVPAGETHLVRVGDTIDGLGTVQRIDTVNNTVFVGRVVLR